MNLIKKTTMILSVALALWSCSDDDDPTNGGNNNATISLSAETLQVDNKGGESTVTVTSSGEWRLSGVCDWAHPSATSGKSGDVVTFTIDPNSLDEQRDATFKFFTGSSVASLKVESQPGYVMELLSDENISISKDKNPVSVQLNTNVAEPTITYSEGGESWLSFDKRSEFGGKVSMIFNATENDKFRNRTTAVTISSPLVAEPVTFTVTQKQTDVLIVESSTTMYDLTERTVSFDVKYNVAYNVSVTAGESWLTQKSATDPKESDDGISTVTYTYHLDAATATRGGVISIKSDDNKFVNDISIVQKDPDTELATIPDNVLRNICQTNGWILPIAGSQCIVLEDGLTATSLQNSSYYNKIGDLTGIENFPNLTTINLGYCDKSMTKMDISKLHKVTTLSFSEALYCEEFNLGNNPIEEFKPGDYYTYSYVSNIKIISSKAKSIDCTINESYAEWFDLVTSIDVSECPALTTLNAKRSSSITTLYLKTGQVIPNLTKNENTRIVYK